MKYLRLFTLLGLLVLSSNLSSSTAQDLPAWLETMLTLTAPVNQPGPLAGYTLLLMVERDPGTGDVRWSLNFYRQPAERAPIAGERLFGKGVELPDGTEDKPALFALSGYEVDPLHHRCSDGRMLPTWQLAQDAVNSGYRTRLTLTSRLADDGQPLAISLRLLQRGRDFLFMLVSHPELPQLSQACVIYTVNDMNLPSDLGLGVLFGKHKPLPPDPDPPHWPPRKVRWWQRQQHPLKYPPPMIPAAIAQPSALELALDLRSLAEARLAASWEQARLSKEWLVPRVTPVPVPTTLAASR